MSSLRLWRREIKVCGIEPALSNVITLKHGLYGLLQQISFACNARTSYLWRGIYFLNECKIKIVFSFKRYVKSFSEFRSYFDLDKKIQMQYLCYLQVWFLFTTQTRMCNFQTFIFVGYKVL